MKLRPPILSRRCVLSSIFGAVALTALLGEYAGASNAGQVLGVRQSAECVAGIVAPWLAGRMYDARHWLNDAAPGSLPFVVGGLVQLVLGVVPPLLLPRATAGDDASVPAR